MTVPRKNPEKAFRQRLAQMRSAYVERAQVQAAQLTGLYGAAIYTDVLEQIRDLAHQIRGTSGTLGFGSVSDSAGALEDAIDAGAPAERIADLARCLECELTKLQ